MSNIEIDNLREKSDEQRREEAILSLQRRLNLVNYVESRMKRNDVKYKPLTIDQLGIDLEEVPIRMWILKNNKHIDSLREHFMVHGTDWQKARLTERFVETKKVKS